MSPREWASTCSRASTGEKHRSTYLFGLPGSLPRRWSSPIARITSYSTPTGIVLKLSPAEPFQLAIEGPPAGERQDPSGYRRLWRVYRRLKNRPLRLRINFSLTLLRLAHSYAIPALDGEQRTPALGWCGTKLHPSGAAVRLGCVLPGKPPGCVTAVLEHKPSGRRNPETIERAGYAPYSWRYGPDAMSRPLAGRNSFPFRDPSGLARFPVDGPQLAESSIVLEKLRGGRTIVTRYLEIPDIRLEELEAQENGR